MCRFKQSSQMRPVMNLKVRRREELDWREWLRYCWRSIDALRCGPTTTCIITPQAIFIINYPVFYIGTNDILLVMDKYPIARKDCMVQIIRQLNSEFDLDCSLMLGLRLYITVRLNISFLSESSMSFSSCSFSFILMVSNTSVGIWCSAYGACIYDILFSSYLRARVVVSCSISVTFIDSFEMSSSFSLYPS